MTPLSDALTAAQRRAIQAMEKAYLSGMGTPESVTEQLKLCGITDTVDVAHLLQCLDTLKILGADLPAEPSNGKPADEQASEAQKSFISDLLGRQNKGTPDLAGLTKAQASDLINEIQAGTYDPAKWSVPF